MAEKDMATASRNCPGCGRENLANAPGGLCARCLLRLGLEAHLPMGLAGRAESAGTSTIYRPDSEDRYFERASLAGSAHGAASGILNALDASIGPIPRVLLCDSGADDLRVVPPVSEELPELAGDPGRYLLSGEIARGGMGVIFRGYDVDLGRDLAVKVIREQHRDHPDIIRRFAIEAQIGGQLQHPGIVPVYGIGRLHDGRLYIAMKLVKGRTLAAFLKLREEASVDRARYLSVFEQVCQTMAYAHARGVVHRDLKPSNVMLGDFGEVQVMDWGLAKVLDRAWAEQAEAAVPAVDSDVAVRTLRTGSNTSESRSGSVLGTPGYMAPEQARGAHDTLDERADVFGLGSILCEILTGSPAYSGRSSEELYRKAERADLNDALVRLDGCGADRELVDLAKSCLAPAAKDRPRNAGVVLSRVTGYLEGVQLRLTAASLAQAQAEARAVEERKRRILTMALAATIVVTGLLAATTWAWLANEQAAREAKEAHAEVEQRAVAVRELNDALDEAARALAEARLGAQDQSKWDLAIQAAKRAESLQHRDRSGALPRGRAQAILADITRERNAAAAIGKDQKMVERLTRIHDDVGVHGEAARADAEWSEAFRDYGVDLDALSVEEAGARLKSSQVAVELAGMLDQWTFVRAHPLRNPAGAERLVEIAKIADPDPWRNRLRNTLSASGHDRGKAREKLERLAADADTETLPAASATRLAFALGRAGNRTLAVSLLKRAQRIHPNGFWVNCDLGRELKESGQYEEAIRFFSIAVAMRPQSEMAQSDLAAVLQKGGRLEEAAATFRRAIQIRPDNALAHAGLGGVLLEQGFKSEAFREFSEAKRARSNDWVMRIAIGDSLANLGDWDAAIAEYQEAIHEDSRNVFAYDKLGTTLLDMGRIDEAIRSYQEAIRRVRHPFGPMHANLGRALMARGDLAGAIKSFRRALELGPPDWVRPRAGRVGLEEAERLAALERRLPGVLSGADHPTSAMECADFARLAGIKNHPGESARLWAQAFAEQPQLSQDLDGNARFSAACSALLASSVTGKRDGAVTSAAERAQLRHQALDWLNADIAAYAELLKNGRPASRLFVRKRLAEWRVVPGLQSLRDERGADDFSDREGSRIREFWLGVESLGNQVHDFSLGGD